MAAFEYALDKARALTEKSLDALKADGVEALIEEFRNYYFSPSFDVAMEVMKSFSSSPEMSREIASKYSDYRFYVEDRWENELIGRGWAKDAARDLIALTSSVIRGFAIRSMITPDKKEYQRLTKLWLEIVRSYFHH